jgi:hypothetical protein
MSTNETETGQQPPAQNRPKRAAYSAGVVLPNESPDIFNELQALFTNLFQPRDAHEMLCLSDMVIARWRIRRLRAAETANMELAMEDARATLHSGYRNLTPAHELALAYRSMTQSNNGNSLLRLEDQQQRVYDRSYRALVRHRGRNSALPSASAIAVAEDALPADNFVAFNPFETKIDTQNCGLEPEMPADEPAPLTRASPPEPLTANKDYQDEYKLMQPVFAALDEVDPQLRSRVAQALQAYKARDRTPKAA